MLFDEHTNSLLIIVLHNLPPPCKLPQPGRGERERERDDREFLVIFVIVPIMIMIIVIHAWTSYITCLTC